jgi:Sec-independent protein translocase protein TatA
MFGFSFAELLIVLVVALFFIKPQDLPEIAHFCGKIFYRIKSFYKDIKNSFKDVEGELGLSDLKDEFNRSVAEEKSKLEDEFTIIVDMEGNEHRVPNVAQLRSDLSEEELKEEVIKNNKNNSPTESDLPSQTD